jgi:NAD(P)H dehydrogenase (quinone)
MGQMDTLTRTEDLAGAGGRGALKVLLVLAHPERRSFSGAMADAAIETLTVLGHEVMVSDLYRMGFDPVSDRRNFAQAKEPDYYKQQVEEDHATETQGFAPDVAAEIAKLEAADLLIFQFPLWWFGLPAILKGWVDKVFAFNRVYGHGHFYEKGKFRGKRALLSLTTGGSGEAAYQPDGFNGDINGVLRPIQRGMFEFLGYDVLKPQIVYGPAQMTEEQRTATLANWRARLRQIAQEEAIGVGRY